MQEPLKGLEIVNLIGVFYQDKNRLFLVDEFEGTVDVEKAMSSVIGQEVRLLAHHRPLEPHSLERWGGGCCLLENTGTCHFGHHVTPQTLFTFNEVGILKLKDLSFTLESKQGSFVCDGSMLMGHRSQIVITTIPNLDAIDEKVRSFDPSNIENPTLDNLTERLTQIRDFLLELDKLKSTIDG